MHFSLVYIEKTVYGDTTAWYGIFLINNSNNQYQVNYVTWWYYSDNEDIYQLDEKEKPLWILLPHSRILVEENDLWQLDISWYVILKLKGGIDHKISFIIWKWAPDWEAIKLDWFDKSGILMSFEIE
jgi:hypothetical protein